MASVSFVKTVAKNVCLVPDRKKKLVESLVNCGSDNSQYCIFIMAYPKLDIIDPETTPLVAYGSSIKSGTHGDVYQKQLAQLLLLRLAREGKDFNLAYELTSADKFDDVVLYDRTAKQWIFLQSKHADGKDSRIDLNGLLPKANREKGDFNLYKYFTSFMLIRDRFKGKLKFLLFTNKKLDENLKTAEDYMSIDDRDVDRYLHFTFEGATHKVLTPTESTVQSIMEYANKDFYSLKDAITELFTTGIISNELRKYKAYLSDILKESENKQISFKYTFNDLLILMAKLYKVLQPELHNMKPIVKPPEFNVNEPEYEYASCPLVDGQDFEHLVAAIKDLFRSGSVSDHLKKYENLLALILTTTADGQLAFKDTFNWDLICKAALYSMLKAELSDMNKVVTTKQKLFDGKDSRNKTHPVLYADASDVRHFFALLTLSAHQPHYLQPFIVEELHLWMRQWLRPDVLGKLTEVDDKNAVRDLDDYFDAALQCEQGNSKPYLNQFFLTEYYSKLQSKIVEQNAVLNDTNQLYINRVITFENEEKEVHRPETLKAPQFDGKKISQIHRGFRRFALHNYNTRKPELEMNNILSHVDKIMFSSLVEKIKTVIHDKISLSNTPDEEMSDSQFAANLRTRFLYDQCLVLTADPGIGKTELLQYVALEHQKLQSGAVFLFYLNRIQDSKDSSLDVLRSTLSKKNVELIQNVLDEKIDDHITILFDGYDEIREKNRNKIENLFALFMKSKQIQLVISARSHKKLSLQSFFQKHKLNVRYFSLESFSSKNITDYLAQSWNENGKCDANPKFITYSKFLIDKFYRLCRVPLMTKMVSEIYKSRYKLFQSSYMTDEDIEINYLDKEFLEVEHIYEKFIEKCLEVKTEDACDGIGKLDSNKRILDGFYVNHQLLAIKCIDVNELKFIFRNPQYKKKLDIIQTDLKKQFEKSILVKFVDDKVFFTHYSYAEYFVASFLWDNFEYVKNTIKNVLSCFPGIRKFFIKIIEKEDISFVSEVVQEASLFSEEFVLWACESNAIELLKFVISKENQRWTKEEEMLQIAIINGSDKICSYLIDDCQVHPDVELYGGFAPLHVAIEGDQRHIVQLLLEKGADVNIRDAKLNSDTPISAKPPLHFSLFGNKGAEDIIIKGNVNIGALTHENCTPLHLACLNGHKEIVEILIRRKANIDALALENSTPLHLACLNGHKEVVEILIKEKANVDTLDERKLTPLHFACHKGHKEVVEVLIREEANIDALAFENFTPFHLACLNGHKEVVKVLIREKANIEALALENCTPLHLACLHGHKEVAEILIREKANIDALELKNCTPLHLACLNGHKEVVEILIRGKANIDAMALENYTPLHLACQNGQKEVVKVLVREKININALALENCTPLHLACLNGHKEVVEILVREKANIDALDEKKYTPLHLACQNGHKEVVEILIKENANIDALALVHCTPLHLASLNGHTEVVEILIREKANIDALDRENCTPLHLACLNGHKEVAEVLIRKIANVNALDEKKSTPLHLACQNGHKEVVEILIREKANIDAMALENYTPLHLACLNGQKEVVEVLIREKANIDALALEHCTPLHLASLNGHTEVVEILVREKANIDTTDFRNCTPLHLACLNGHKEVAEVLIREIANVNALDEKKTTPLHLACQNGHKEVVEILIRGKASIDAMALENYTPLHLACQNGQKEVVEILIREKANIDALARENCTPIHLASLNGHKEVVEILAREKANIDATDFRNCTPLHLACLNGHKEVAEVLIRKVANVNALDEKKATPLHLACQNGHKEVVEILIRGKANIDATDFRNCTPLHLACFNGHKEVVEILVREKANIDALEFRNCTPLHLACQNGHKEVVEILIREKSNVDALAFENCTPLHLACLNGHKEVVEILVRKKANIDALNHKNCKPLHVACLKGHKEVVEILARETANIDAVELRNFTALHLACLSGHKEVVEILVKEKANVDALAENSFTPLHLACLNGHKEAVEILIREKANVDALDAMKSTPLHMACQNGHKEVVEVLLRENDNVDAVDEKNFTPLHLACQNGHEKVVEVLVRQQANVDALAEKNYTPLHLVCLNGHKEIVEVLIREQANVEALTEQSFTPLHLACHNGHKEVVEILIREKANVHALAEKNCTPLHLACYNGHKEVVEILIRENANLHALAEKNFTTLHFACQNGHKEVVEILLRENANIEALDQENSTPLHVACQNGHKKVVEILLRENANINALDDKYRTPLDLAYLNGHEEVEALIRDAN
nr:uncharacterized protein LOC109416384 [Aedes albopictus]